MGGGGGGGGRGGGGPRSLLAYISRPNLGQRDSQLRTWGTLAGGPSINYVRT